MELGEIVVVGLMLLAIPSGLVLGAIELYHRGWKTGFAECKAVDDKFRE